VKKILNSTKKHLKKAVKCVMIIFETDLHFCRSGEII